MSPRLIALIASCALSLAFAAPASADDLSGPGSYSAGWTEVQVARPGGSTFTATLYYPAESEGPGAPIDSSGGPYAAISFGHGFLQAVSQYESTLEHLATWGYFAIASQSAGGLFPNHASFADDMSHCLTWLEEQNANAGSDLFGLVDVDRFGLSGHSMGGGASILAAADDPRVRALANLAAADTNPSAIDAMAQVDMPVRLISGDMDTIVPPSQHGELMYANGSAPRQHIVIQGGFHCGFVDSNFLFCDSGDISRAEQLALTRQLLTEFFNLHLKGDQSQWLAVWGPQLDADPLVSTTSDPGIGATPATQSLEGEPGQIVSTTVTVQNTSARADSYDILDEGSTWIVTTTPNVVGPLNPGESGDVDVAIEIAGGGADTAEVIVSARSQLDGGTRGYATIFIERLLAADLTGDGLVNSDDLFELLGHWGLCSVPADCPADLTGDGAVNSDDLFLLLGQWTV